MLNIFLSQNEIGTLSHFCNAITNGDIEEIKKSWASKHFELGEKYNGKMPLELAMESKKPEIIEELLKFYMEVKSGQWEVFQLLKQYFSEEREVKEIKPIVLAINAHIKIKNNYTTDEKRILFKIILFCLKIEKYTELALILHKIACKVLTFSPGQVASLLEVSIVVLENNMTKVLITNLKKLTLPKKNTSDKFYEISNALFNAIVVLLRYRYTKQASLLLKKFVENETVPLSPLFCYLMMRCEDEADIKKLLGIMKINFHKLANQLDLHFKDQIKQKHLEDYEFDLKRAKWLLNASSKFADAAKKYTWCEKTLEKELSEFEIIASDDIEEINSLVLKLKPEKVIFIMQRLTTGLYCSAIPIFLQYHKTTIINDKLIQTQVEQTHCPKLAIAFMHWIKFTQEKWLELYLTAQIEGDMESLEEIQKQLGSSLLQKATNYEYIPIKITPVDFEQPTPAAYGEGLSQAKYRVYQERIAVIIASAFLRGDLHLLFASQCPQTTLCMLNLNNIGDFRTWIAWLSGTEKKEDFGKERAGFLYTAFEANGRYIDYLKKFSTKIFPTFKLTPCVSHNGYWLGENSCIPLVCIVGEIPGPLTSKKVSLTSYGYKHKRSYEGTIEYSNTPHWQHTNHKDIPTILEYVNQLLLDLRKLYLEKKQNITLQEIIPLIAKIHWWLAHTSPYRRGSAACGEAIVQGLFRAFGFVVVFNEFPDCEILISPSIDDFAKNYVKIIINFVKFLPKSTSKAEPDFFKLSKTAKPIELDNPNFENNEDCMFLSF